MKLKLFVFSALMLISYNYVFAQRVYVLCYHSFLGRPDVSTDFSLDEMKEHINILKDGGMKFVSIDDLLSGNIQGNNNVLITIDDGNRSVYPAYKQVFKPNGIPVTLALYNGSIGRSKYLLTWDQVDDLVKDGISIMSHGYFSEKLYDHLYETNKKIFEREIYSPKQTFEARYTNTVSALAYPFGVYSDSAIKTIKNAGYKIAFTILPGKVEIPYIKNANQYMLPRYMIVRGGYKKQLLSVINDSKK